MHNIHVYQRGFKKGLSFSFNSSLYCNFFNKSSKTLKYISDSSYWIYIIHPILIPFIGSVFYYDKINVHIQFFLSSILLTIACFLSYHYLVRKTFIGKFLNEQERQRLAVELKKYECFSKKFRQWDKKY